MSLTLLILCFSFPFLHALIIHPTTRHQTILNSGGDDGVESDTKNQQDLEQQAQELLAEARRLRQEITHEIGNTDAVKELKMPIDSTTFMRKTEWSVNSSYQSPQYRLYIDIGREEGTWMDPRWGASGRRIEFSLDIALSSVQASNQIVSAMVQDNQKGQSSPTYSVETASKARLNRGFDSMKVYPGGFRVDQTKNGGTMRFFVSVEGTKKGDVSIPKGYLYFSLPCFGGITSIEKIILSTKDGIVSVRQVGWHTGWRRIESRIVGTFRAVPIEKARQMDGY